MNEMFPCGIMQPPGIKVFGVTDNAVIYGNEQIPFSSIAALRAVVKPTMLTNGVAQMQANGKVYTLAYRYKDRARAAAALSYAQQCIAAAHK